MTDLILVSGDTVAFDPGFGAAKVIPQPGILQGSGPLTIESKKACVDGDEKKVKVPGCTYITSLHTIPGNGTITIKELNNDQTAEKTFINGKAALLKGSKCDAQFMVLVPAQQPGSPPVPDTVNRYIGKGRFIPKNTTTKGT